MGSDAQLAGQLYKQYDLWTQSLVYDQSSSVGLCMQDYKSLHAVVMMCATLVNTQTHTQTASNWLDSLYKQDDL